ncbi:hypothetical protein BDY21DRAFT_424840 [Lineolata rhizophorae]|uniref:Karyogamy protein 5 n=1 Tax=Lineolata rhizophorae TaxID=578093 RepID=A0A6A6NN73_9PEZI|nr:hypothetical protein BDY21DRAFT_424840 [Lineolata rhizophorae]
MHLPSLHALIMRFALLVFFVGVLAADNSAPSGDSSNLSDLEALLKGNTLDTARNFVFAEAVRVLQKMEPASYCAHKATTDLVSSCQSLERPDTSPDFNFDKLIETVPSVYAVRLAACELSEAGVILPPDCDFIMSTTFVGFSSLPASDQEAVHEKLATSLKVCLERLSHYPQSWTSYSNARQSSVLICHACRSAIEEQELNDRYRRMAEMGASFSESLAQQMSAYMAELREDAEVVQANMRELKLTQEVIVESTNHVLHEIHRAYAKSVASINQTFKTVEEYGLDLMDNMDHSQAALAKSFEDLLDTRNEIQSTSEYVAANAAEVTIAMDEVKKSLPSLGRHLEALAGLGGLAIVMFGLYLVGGKVAGYTAIVVVFCAGAVMSLPTLEMQQYVPEIKGRLSKISAAPEDALMGFVAALVVVAIGASLIALFKGFNKHHGANGGKLPQ